MPLLGLRTNHFLKPANEDYLPSTSICITEAAEAYKHERGMIQHGVCLITKIKVIRCTCAMYIFIDLCLSIHEAVFLF